MTTSAFVGGFQVEISDSPSPAVDYSTLPEVISISGVGQTNDLVDATHFGSGGSREYIGGLADGSEITLECNYVANDADQEAVIAMVAAKTTHTVRITVTGSSPNVTLTFAAAAIGWEIGPQVDDRNTISFTFKISGSITVA